MGYECDFVKVKRFDYCSFIDADEFQNELNDKFESGTLIDYYCSEGRLLTEIIRNAYSNNDMVLYDGINIINKSDLYIILVELCHHIEELDLRSGNIVNYFIENDDDSITVSSCDGIELKTDDGLIKRIYSSDDYDGAEIIVTNVHKLHMIQNFIKTILKCIKESDDSMILFTESY